MLHVIIADDEERICRLINMLGHWEKHGMEVAGTAQNGPQALSMVEKGGIDLLITDIRMPGLSGLELITKARAVSPKIRFIIISGYADFSYAQDAIKLGVSEYLLKPVSEEALNDTLGKISRQIRAESEKESAYQSALQENEEILSRTRSGILYDLKHAVGRDYSVSSLWTENRFDAGKGSMRVFCIRADAKAGESTDTQDILQASWENAGRILHAELDRETYDLVLWPDGFCLYGLLQIREGCEKKTEAALRRSLNTLEGRNDVLGGFHFSMGAGPCVLSPSGLPDTFRCAEKAVCERLVSGRGRVCFLEDETPKLERRSILSAFQREMEQAFLRKDQEELKRALFNFRKAFRADTEARGWELERLVHSALDMAEEIARVPVPEDMKEKAETSLDGCGSMGELFTVFDEAWQKLFAAIVQDEKDMNERPVRIAKHYIADHYTEPLTLEEVSQVVGLAPNYFSGIFKKVTGDGFAHYLISIRMDAAKHYLQETNLSIAEIADKVGYNDVKYFTKTFIKQTGVKPTVFRKLYG